MLAACQETRVYEGKVSGLLMKSVEQPPGLQAAHCNGKAVPALEQSQAKAGQQPWVARANSRDPGRGSSALPAKSNRAA